LKDEDKKALISYINTLGYRISTDNYDHRSGEKIIFRPNKSEKPDTKELPKEEAPTRKIEEYERSVFGEAETEDKAREQAELKVSQVDIKPGFSKNIIDRKPMKLPSGGTKYEIRYLVTNRDHTGNSGRVKGGSTTSSNSGGSAANTSTNPQNVTTNTTTTGTTSKESEISYVQGTSTDQANAQKKALAELRKRERQAGKTATKIEEKAVKSGDIYIYKISYRFE